MANTTFVDQNTVVEAAWLNDVNDVVYDVLGDGIAVPTTSDEVRQNIGAPKTDGTDATGTWAINISGNAATATNSTTVTNGVYTTDIGVTVQAYDANTAKTNGDQNWTGSPRATPVTDNDGSFDMNAGLDFLCTPTAGFTLTFTNIAQGQRGCVYLSNPSAYTAAAAGTTKVTSTLLATISAAGNYWLSYWSPDGTNVLVSAGGPFA